jgi:hypothetical protein
MGSFGSLAENSQGSHGDDYWLLFTKRQPEIHCCAQSGPLASEQQQPFKSERWWLLAHRLRSWLFPSVTAHPKCA